MINREENPVEWQLFLDELNDAKEHLTELLTELQTSPDYDDANFRVDLGHVYSHLKRAWHRKRFVRDLTDAEWEAASEFPKDLEPT